MTHIFYEVSCQDFDSWVGFGPMRHDQFAEHPGYGEQSFLVQSCYSCVTIITESVIVIVPAKSNHGQIQLP